jgi:hypothetical protein
MRWWPVFAAIGAVIALLIAAVLGTANGVCYSDSAPSSFACPGGGGSCLMHCTFWSPAWLIGPVIGALLAAIAILVLHSVTQRSARSITTP